MRKLTVLLLLVLTGCDASCIGRADAQRRPRSRRLSLSPLTGVPVAPSTLSIDSGGGGYLDCGDWTELDGSTEETYGFWVYADSASWPAGTQAIMGRNVGVPDRQFQIRVGSTAGVLSTSFTANGSSSMTTVSTGDEFRGRQWHAILVHRHAPTGTVDVYDLSDEETKVINLGTTVGTLSTVSGSVQILARGSGFNTFGDGFFDDIAVWVGSGPADITEARTWWNDGTPADARQMAWGQPFVYYAPERSPADESAVSDIMGNHDCTPTSWDGLATTVPISRKRPDAATYYADYIFEMASGRERWDISNEGHVGFPSITAIPNGDVVAFDARATAHGDPSSDPFYRVRETVSGDHVFPLGGSVAWPNGGTEVETAISELDFTAEGSRAPIPTVIQSDAHSQQDRVYVLVNHTDISSPPVRSIEYTYSDDNLGTFAAAVAPADWVIGDYWTSIGGGMFEDVAGEGGSDAGDLYLPVYYRDCTDAPTCSTPEGHYTSALVQSDDGGSTWAVHATIAEQCASGCQQTGSDIQWEEPNCGWVSGLTGSPNICCLVRRDDLQEIWWRCGTNSNAGVTWDAVPAKAFDGYGRPQWIQLTNGNLLAITRAPSAEDSRCALWRNTGTSFSSSNWSGPYYLSPTTADDGEQCEYGWLYEASANEVLAVASHQHDSNANLTRLWYYELSDAVE